ncbi:MAG: tetratricopeptide repeat protein [Acidobacteria bacterium]|nr:tetratricopeptide repeat protein [Acidobacteriota bacterium]
MRIKFEKLSALLFCGILGAAAVAVAAQKTSLRDLTVLSEPNASVWIDDVGYGQTDEKGRLALKTFAGGTHRLRVRAAGFREVSQPLTAAQTGELRVALAKTTDEAELAFQQAEAETDKEKATGLYQKALRLRPAFPEAALGLARALLDRNETAAALKAIQTARRLRPVYPEATAVEGRIFKADNQEEKAIASFKKAVTEGRGVQPEALTGLGLLYKERAENFGSSGDFESEKENYVLAADYFKKAVAQLGGAPDATTVYQFLGDCYERAKMYTEAIAVYEEFLRLFPDANEAETFRSFIVQLQKRIREEQ